MRRVWIAGWFLAVVATLAGGETAVGRAESPGKTRVYFGTYTGGKSQGIYRSELDLATGALSPPVLAGEAVNPSFLALRPGGKFLYACSEMQSEGKRIGAVAAFAIDSATGDLKALNKQPSGGGGPCHVSVDPSGSCVLVANYGGGSVSAMPIAADGSLGTPGSMVQHTGSSVNKQRQSAPHAHSINPDPAGRFAFAADLGLDKLLVYKLGAAEGRLTANDPPFASVDPGAGPRHFAFHPSGKFAYVINEISLTVTAFSYDAAKGVLAPMQTIDTLPPGANRDGASTAEVQVHPSGKFLYGSNRGHNSIAVFAIDATTGKLASVGHEGQDVKTPRNFGVDPSGRFVLVANQDGDSVVVFAVDPSTGMLKPTGHKVDVPKPVCVKFAP
ncbi:MAG: lactonase family protein [Planctomycetota bacterium]